jgi:hypothetical protein
MPGNRISSSVLAGLDYFWNPLVKHSLQTVPEVECIVMAVYKWMFLEQSYAVQVQSLDLFSLYVQGEQFVVCQSGLLH